MNKANVIGTANAQFTAQAMVPAAPFMLMAAVARMTLDLRCAVMKRQYRVIRVQPWYAFPGSNGVRITQTIVDNLARIVEQRATPDAVLADMTAQVQRLPPRE